MSDSESCNILNSLHLRVVLLNVCVLDLVSLKSQTGKLQQSRSAGAAWLPLSPPLTPPHPTLPWGQMVCLRCYGEWCRQRDKARRHLQMPRASSEDELFTHAKQRRVPLSNLQTNKTKQKSSQCETGHESNKCVSNINMEDRSALDCRKLCSTLCICTFSCFSLVSHWLPLISVCEYKSISSQFVPELCEHQVCKLFCQLPYYYTSLSTILQHKKQKLPRAPCLL